MSMSDPEFIDTNILLYAKIDDGTDRHNHAAALVRTIIQFGNPCISVQVINEFTVNALRKGKLLSDIEIDVDEFFRTMNVLSLTPSTCRDAFRIARQYQFSFWDSLIVSAALENGCSVLYTEDLSDGQIIDGNLTIKNPLIGE
jgi:predicted nucleic acid-binding protein